MAQTGRGTPVRNFRRDDARWNDMAERAELEGRSVSELINAAIDAFMLTPIERKSKPTGRWLVADEEGFFVGVYDDEDDADLHLLPGYTAQPEVA